MDYTITEITKVTPNAYQDKTGVRFKVQGVEHQLSALTSNPGEFEVGKVVHGTITSKEKDGKVFYNFNQAKSAWKPSVQPAGDLLRVEKKIDVIITELQMQRANMDDTKHILGEILRKITPIDDINKDAF